MSRWWAGAPVTSGVGLARRLHAQGLAVLREPAAYAVADVTVVVPVRDRAAELDRCLAALTGLRVVVVDDGSTEPARVAEVARRHAAQLVVRPVNGGPAAARNTGLGQVTTPLVAFLDSDVVVPPDWLARLLPALAPEVAVVAPRVVSAGGSGLLAWHDRGRGPLDLGPDPGPVHPRGRVGHVPAAALLCRVTDLGTGFDEQLRVGEDVDLVWRLVAGGRQVRYDPSVQVGHAPRAGLRDWLAQRHGYGRSAALLDVRHPGAVAPAAAGPWALGVLAGVALRRPALSVLALSGTAVSIRRRLPQAPGRDQEAVRLAVSGAGWSAVSLAEGAARVWLPVLLPLALVSRRARWASAGVAAVRLARTRTSPVQVLEDLAYGTGVWRGALIGRRPRVLLPRVR